MLFLLLACFSWACKLLSLYSSASVSNAVSESAISFSADHSLPTQVSIYWLPQKQINYIDKKRYDIVFTLLPPWHKSKKKTSNRIWHWPSRIKIVCVFFFEKRRNIYCHYKKPWKDRTSFYRLVLSLKNIRIQVCICICIFQISTLQSDPNKIPSRTHHQPRKWYIPNLE